MVTTKIENDETPNNQEQIQICAFPGKGTSGLGAPYGRMLVCTFLSPKTAKKGRGGAFSLFGALTGARCKSDLPNISEVASLNEANNCDLAVELGAASATNSYADAYSVYTKKRIFRIEAGDIKQYQETILKEFSKDSPLYNQLMADRQSYKAAQSSLAGGLSKAEIEKIVKTTVESATPIAQKTFEAAPPIRSDVDKPGYKMPERPDDFAIIIGVEKYSNDLPDANFAERDAGAVKLHLRAMGYPERNIKFLIRERAVRSAMEAYLEDWLPRNVKENSQVFFYFSGHGAPDPESGQAFLVPRDGNPNFLNKTAYPVKRLYAGLDALKAKQVIVALDSCFSGAGGRSVLAEGTRPLVTTVDASIAPGGKILLFTAASANEITSTLKEQGHGIFTYYFLKGLSGEAKDDSGAVTPQRLYDYLKPRVQDAASRQNRDQTPIIEGATDSALVRFK